MKGLFLKHLNWLIRNSFKEDFELIVFVTNYCNASCEHCFYSTQLNTGVSELNLEAFRKLSRTIPGSCKKIIFGGGEPFLRDDLLEIISIFKERGVSEYAIMTNGILTEKISKFIDSVSKIRDIKITIVVSLDGPEEIHDAIRRHNGAFRKALRTVRILRDKRVDVGIQSVISRSNYQAIKAFDEYIVRHLQMKVHYQFIRGAEISGLPAHLKRDFNPFQKTLLPSEKDMKVFLGMLREVCEQRIKKLGDFLSSVINFTILESKYMIWKKRTNIFPCVAGQTRGVVYPSGEAAICEYMRPAKKKLEDFGYNFNALWNSPELLAQKKIAKNCYCSQGCFIKIIGTRRFLLYSIRNIYRFFPVLVRARFKVKDLR